MAIPEAASRLIPPISELDSFVQDDHEFRTITTLLNALECREKVTVQNFEVVPKLKPYLKILSALSSLLVRDHEVVAILPKRSESGVMLLIGSDESPFHQEDDPPSPPSPLSSSPGRRLRHYVTQNPRNDNQFGGVIELTQHSIVTVGLNVDDFILKNWDQSFDHHVQAFADLLNAAFKNPGTKTANALKRYSMFQSAPKIHRRFKRCSVLRELQKVNVADHMTQTFGSLTDVDRNKITIALYRDSEGQKLHGQLYDYLTNSPSGLAPPSLELHHKFFTWLLLTLADEIEQLRELQQANEPPEKLPVLLIKSAMLHLDILQYLAWQSIFFSKYIETVRPRGSGGQEVSPDNYIDTARQVPSEAEDEELAGDMWTEFETGEDRPADSNSEPPPVPHPWILELRLITSNIHQLKHLLSRLPLREPLSFSFQLIQYAKSDDRLKPWRELVQELFPNTDEENDVLRALEMLGGNRNRQYSMFRRNGPTLKFRGQAHCEAVLGCLYTLARSERATDIRWAKIPKPVLRAAENSYSLLAPSKRCCPVCATIISYLQPDHGPPLQALSKHSIVFPCALPIGLPREVRKRLLATYRADLKTRLRALTRRSQSSGSSSSQQSEPLSDHDNDKEQLPNRGEIEAALEIMDDWEEMSIEMVSTKWEEVKAKLLPAVADACWQNMREDYKLVLTPPSVAPSAGRMS